MEWILPLALACCYEYYAGSLDRRSENHPANAVLFVLFIILLRLAHYYTHDHIRWLWEPLMQYGVPFFYLWSSRRCRALDAFYHTVILFLSVDCILKGFGHLSMILFGQDYVYYASPAGLHLLFVLLPAGLLVLILWLVKKLVFRGERPAVTPAQICLMLLTLLPILYLTNIHQWLHIDRTAVGLDASIVRVMLSFCGLAAILGNESLYYSRLQAQELKSMEAMLHSQYEQFLVKKESTEQIMQQCHDLKNQFRVLQLSSDTGLRRQYMEQLQKTIDRYDSLYQTGNETLDIILSEKALRCQEEQIQLICMLRGEPLSFLSPVDLCTIFGNALDNALEGLAGVADPDKRRIQVRMTQENSLLFIRFENPYEHALHWDGYKLATTKADEAGHGYGLKGIRYAAEKYQGHVVIDADGGVFVLTVMLPCPEGAEAKKSPHPA